jgi:hypothetical protein
MYPSHTACTFSRLVYYRSLARNMFSRVISSSFTWQFHPSYMFIARIKGSMNTSTL